MSDRRWVSAFVLLLVSLPGFLFAQSTAWHDPSPHRVQFVTVDQNVRLEVLDWGGSGRPIVLLSGLGNTAHVFDDFAPKLTPEYHVYGITRRGFGASSVPTNGYSADRLGDDVLAVLDALKLDRPVLVGHSIAGEELSSVATRHPERIAGLVYLDAGFPYAYYDRSQGDFTIDWEEAKKKVDQVLSGVDRAAQEQLVQQLLQANLPVFERDLQRMQKNLADAPPHVPPPPAPTVSDQTSFSAWDAYQKRVFGWDVPEGEVHQQHEFMPDGHVGSPKPDNDEVYQGIIEGEQKYTDIPVAVLAIFAVPHGQGPYARATNPTAAGAAEARDEVIGDGVAKAFETGVPTARVVRLAQANHYVFISNEADVLREMRTFLVGLK